MIPEVLAVVLWCAPIDSPFAVVVREKYGPTITIEDATCVVEKGGSYYVLRRGRLRGVYPTANYAVERK